jgi:hypothetical protein
MPNPYLLWGVGMGVTVALIGLIWVQGERAQRRLRAEVRQRHQELQARTERGRQEREEALERAAERAERSLALQQEAVELARQSARHQEAILALLQRLIDEKPRG